MNRIWSKFIAFFPIALLVVGCNSFLEEKSDKSLGVPSTVEDFRALLNDSQYLNSNFSSMGEASTDDFYLSDADLNGLYYDSDKRLYSWMPDNVTRDASGAGNEWSFCYEGVYVSNSILKGIEENNLTGRAIDEIRGQALVFRAARYLDGVQIWAPVYNKETADKDLGMVLRLDPDMNMPSVRSTVQETYDTILDDLTQAISLLPVSTISPALPTKAAAYGLLARAYLIMGDYEKALFNADSALRFHHELIDFNGLDVQAEFPIPVTNQTSREIVFFTRMFSSDIVNNFEIANISKELYDMYADSDLRKVIYFRVNDNEEVAFKGTHMGHVGLITGITSSELLLIAAECQVRLDRLDRAAEVLNYLLEARWVKNDPMRYVFDDKSAALKIVLEERRKELVFRGLRWSDIKRLNRDGADISLKRRINGQEVVLSPGDKRYAIALPEDMVEITGISQNPR